MAFAKRSSRCVAPSQPRKRPSGSGRIVLKSLTAGLATVAIGFAAVVAVMCGGASLFAVISDARSGTRSTLASLQRPERLASADAPARKAATAAGRSPYSSEQMYKTPVLEPLGSLALVIPASLSVSEEPSGDPPYTGSVDPFASRFAGVQADLQVASADPDDNPLSSDNGRSSPRARTRVASLAPTDGLKIGTARGADAAGRSSAASAGAELPPRTPDTASVRGLSTAAAFADVGALPLPPRRPRLASLTPMDDLGVTPDDEHRHKTAIYDIKAQVVYLPNGERLEAHSGLGEFMDNPRFVRLKNRGATPPHVYDLTLRETLFHGVRAIRLTPVGDGLMFGRDGILAHSYMLGPSGQSNGCISFRDYPRFLRAYLQGEVDRIVVVTHLDKPPAFARRGLRRTANAL